MYEALKKALELYNVPPLNEMAYGRKQMAAILVHQTDSIVSLWGYLYFLTHYGDRNNLLNHEKGKLLGLFGTLQDYEVKDGDAAKTKKNFAAWNADIPRMPTFIQPRISNSALPRPC